MKKHKHIVHSVRVQVVLDRRREQLLGGEFFLSFRIRLFFCVFLPRNPFEFCGRHLVRSKVSMRDVGGHPQPAVLVHQHDRALPGAWHHLHVSCLVYHKYNQNGVWEPLPTGASELSDVWMQVRFKKKKKKAARTSRTHELLEPVEHIQSDLNSLFSLFWRSSFTSSRLDIFHCTQWNIQALSLTCDYMWIYDSRQKRWLFSCFLNKKKNIQ